MKINILSDEIIERKYINLISELLFLTDDLKIEQFSKICNTYFKQHVINGYHTTFDGDKTQYDLQIDLTNNLSIVIHINRNPTGYN